MGILVHFGTLITLGSPVLVEGCDYIVVLVEKRYWDINVAVLSFVTLACLLSLEMLFIFGR